MSQPESRPFGRTEKSQEEVDYTVRNGCRTLSKRATYPETAGEADVNGLPYASRVNYAHSLDLRTMQEIFHVTASGSSPYLGDAANATDLLLDENGAEITVPEISALSLFAPTSGGARFQMHLVPTGASP